MYSIANCTNLHRLCSTQLEMRASPTTNSVHKVHALRIGNDLAQRHVIHNRVTPTTHYTQLCINNEQQHYIVRQTNNYIGTITILQSTKRTNHTNQFPNNDDGRHIAFNYYYLLLLLSYYRCLLL